MPKEDDANKLIGTNEEKIINRRRVLKASGIGLAAASLPIAGMAKSKGYDPSTVDTSDPQSMKKFVLRVLNVSSEQEAKSLWQQLGAEKAPAVANYMNEHSTTEIGPIKTDTQWDTVITKSGTLPTERVESSAVSPQSARHSKQINVQPQGVFLGRYNVPVKRKTAGVLIYKMNHVMGWGKTSNGMYFTQDRSYGAGHDPGNLWHDIRQSYFSHHTYYNHVNSYISREYKHSAPFVCDKFNAKVDLRGHRDGRLELIRKNPNFNKHSC